MRFSSGGREVEGRDKNDRREEGIDLPFFPKKRSSPSPSTEGEKRSSDQEILSEVELVFARLLGETDRWHRQAKDQ